MPCVSRAIWHAWNCFPLGLNEEPHIRWKPHRFQWRSFCLHIQNLLALYMRCLVFLTMFGYSMDDVKPALLLAAEILSIYRDGGFMFNLILFNKTFSSISSSSFHSISACLVFSTRNRIALSHFTARVPTTDFMGICGCLTVSCHSPNVLIMRLKTPCLQ